jgi:hypothetical protein
MPWSLLQLVATLYCLVRGCLDLRGRSYAWGAVGSASAIILLAMPNPNNVISVTIPAADAAR